MKLSKVLFGSALIATLVFGFASCKEDEDEHKILEVSGSKATVDYTNDTSTLQRGFVTTKTNHRAAVAARLQHENKRIGLFKKTIKC